MIYRRIKCDSFLPSLFSFILNERDISIQIIRFIPQRRYNYHKHIEKTIVFQISKSKIIKKKGSNHAGTVYYMSPQKSMRWCFSFSVRIKVPFLRLLVTIHENHQNQPCIKDWCYLQSRHLSSHPYSTTLPQEPLTVCEECVLSELTYVNGRLTM